jgi:hypothetical protein
MKPYQLFVLLCLTQSGWAHAEIYKRVDAQGHVTYSSEPIKGGKKLDLKPLPTMSGASTSATPEDFPKVDTQTQRSRDETRRAILQDELATEEKLLATARENLKNIENNPETRVSSAGIPFQPTPEYTEKLKAAQNTVALHEQNIKALKTEMVKLR